MDEVEIRGVVEEAGADVHVVDVGGTMFYFVGEDRILPFATLVNNDFYDAVSSLHRPGVYRLNMGVSEATFASLFPDGAGTEYDLAALDRLLPHPVYAQAFWVCVLNPGDELLTEVRRLLSEAYELSRARQAKREVQASE